jgi:Zierdtviridae exonuclease
MPATNVLIRGSEARTYRRCRQQWHWTYRRRLRPKRQKGALTFGTIWHIAMEGYYPPGRKRGKHPAATFERVYIANEREFSQWDEEGNKVDALELGITMAVGYVEKYGDDDTIEIVHPEEAFEIDIYDRDGSYLCTFVGKFDALAYSHKTGRYFILEHKSAKSIENINIISNYGDQGLGYAFAADIWLKHLGVMKKHANVDGVMYNVARKGIPDQRPRNPAGLYLNKPSKTALLDRCGELGIVTPKRTIDMMTEALVAAGHDPTQLGEPSKVQPPPLFGRQEIILTPAHYLAFETRLRKQAMEMQKVREKRLPIFKNPTRDCSWDCAFFHVCEVHEMGGDWRDMLAMDFRKWSPYSDHELEEERRS